MGNQEPQILGSLQKDTSHRIILGPLSHNGLQTSSRNSKENTDKGIDRQLAGQTSSTPFMNIRDSFNKRVTFDMTDSMEQKIVQTDDHDG